METKDILSHKFGFVTFTPHPSEIEVLNHFHNLFFPMISLKSKFVGFSTEKHGTPDQHIHYIFTLPPDGETQKLKARIFVKSINDFKKYLKREGKLTVINDNNTQALNYKYVKNTNEDKLKTIGYVFKDNSPSRHTPFPEDFITQAVKFYYANRKIDKSEVKSDWHLLTPKNVYTKLPHICKENNIDCYGPNLLANLSYSKVGIANITPKQLKSAYLQLKIHELKDDPENSQIMNALINELNDSYEWDFLESCKFHNKMDEVLSQKNKQIQDLVRQKKEYKEMVDSQREYRHTLELEIKHLKEQLYEKTEVQFD